jgi:transcriptional regulator with XRE-family HTH domain
MAGEEQDRLALRLRELLVEARNARGMTQTDLAKALGRTQTYVSNYERGERRVGVVDFILIARALKAEPVELLRQVD